MRRLSGGRRRGGRRRAAANPRSRRNAPLALGVLSVLLLCAGIGAVVSARPPARPARRASAPTPAALLHQALARTLAGSFHVAGTISEGQNTGTQQVVGDVDLGHRRAKLTIQLGSGSVTERVMLLPGRTYQTLLAPPRVAALLPKGTRWVAESAAMPGLVLGADNALSALEVSTGSSQVACTAHWSGRAARFQVTRGPAATTTEESPLPPDTDSYTVDRYGRVVSLQEVTYARTPFAQGGLSGVLSTTIVLHLSGFGERVTVSAPPAAETVDAARYDQLLHQTTPGAIGATPTPSPAASP